MRVARACTFFGLLLLALVLPGCLERELSVTSDPPGARVIANDVELGRTPCKASFRFYGTYDVRVEKDGYEPIRARVPADAPIYEYPPFDLLATAIPANIEHVVKWHFKLEPALETRLSPERLQNGMLERAAALRSEIK